MSKIRVTKKYVNDFYDFKIEIGYCNAQHLLRHQNPFYYTCGVYGWNSDVYYINSDTVIVTGYRPFGNIKPDYKLVHEYDEKARKIECDYSLNWKEQETAINTLLDEFICKVME